MRHTQSSAGFSLLEALIATGIMAVALAALGQMFAIAVANNTSARSGSYATVLAEQKMEQLRGLTWGFDTLGLTVADSTTNTAAAVETPAGGTGLSTSPRATLTSNVPGYVDYLDQFGSILGGGPVMPASAVYVRRWSVEPLPTSLNALVLQVLVTKRATRGAADVDGATRRLPDEARLVSVKARKAR